MPNENSARHPHAKSLWTLDALNFFLPDIQSGTGPFLAIYLFASLHWNPAQIGAAISIAAVAVVIAQTPAGAVVDVLRQKRLLVALASVVIAFGTLAIVKLKSFHAIAAIEALTGAASSVFPPAVAAISLGLVGRLSLARRLARNAAWNNTGNVTFAVVAGLMARYVALDWIFYLAAAAGALAVAAVLAIREGDIDHAAAREAPAAGGQQVVSLSDLFSNRRIPAFMAAAVLFHLANAAMLPLVGELLSSGKPVDAPLYMSACITVAQCVMIPVALATGRLADSWGRKPLFQIALAVLCLRGILFTVGCGAGYLVSVQALDGVSASIFAVVSVLIMADLARGTGRFNLLQGVTATAVGLGASLSNVLAGVVVRSWGYKTGFLLLASVAFLGLLFFSWMIPETKCQNPGPDRKVAPALECLRQP
jgi:MFS family permease